MGDELQKIKAGLLLHQDLESFRRRKKKTAPLLSIEHQGQNKKPSLK
jgi:hypothetical protein